MLEDEVIITTTAGPMNTFVVRPDEEGPFPVVLFYMDAPGKREELHDMARRIASAGYLVALPNLYYRETPRFDMQWDDAGREAMFAMTRHLSIELIMDDTRELLKFVDDHADADSSRVGAVGYCMSGPFVFAAAARFAERINCAASIYGANLLTKRTDSPHLGAKDIKGEMYFACAEIDHYAPKEQIDELEAHLKALPINSRLEWYPGAEHGFAFPGRGSIYHKPSAERHWARLHSLFQRSLKAAV